MAFEQPPLPYDMAALEPHTSANTLSFHYGKHHAGYVKKLNAAVEGTNMSGMSLQELVIEANKGNNKGIFNNAAQTWNHSFFWNCMAPNGGGKPEEKSAIGQKIVEDFGSFDNFSTEFAKTAGTQFGSGWGWLVVDKDGKLRVTATKDAENPMTNGDVPILTIDVWEHAYYLDYQNRRPDFISTFQKHLLNWKFVEDNYEQAVKKSAL